MMPVCKTASLTCESNMSTVTMIYSHSVSLFLHSVILSLFNVYNSCVCAVSHLPFHSPFFLTLLETNNVLFFPTWKLYWTPFIQIYSGGGGNYLIPCWFFCPLTKKWSVYNCNGRFILEVRDKMTTKKSRKMHFNELNNYLTPSQNMKGSSTWSQNPCW